MISQYNSINVTEQNTHIFTFLYPNLNCAQRTSFPTFCGLIFIIFDNSLWMAAACRKGELKGSSLLLSKPFTVFYDVNPFINTSECHFYFLFNIVFIKAVIKWIFEKPIV